MDSLIVPNWPAPKNIHAFSTTRQGGVSKNNFAEFNLAQHVGDDLLAVTENRQILRTLAKLPDEPCWLNQTHSTIALPAQSKLQTADANFTQEKNQICVVLTADCLPILLCDKQGSVIAAIHAGWRGLAKGIIEETVKQLPMKEYLAWLGPAISVNAFEVGCEVRDEFLQQNNIFSRYFIPSTKDQHYYADLYGLATCRLRALGINQIYGGEFCTYGEQQRFFSYRRDKQTGRMATLIWLS